MRFRNKSKQIGWCFVFCLIPALLTGYPFATSVLASSYAGLTNKLYTCPNMTEPYISLYGQRTDVLVGEEVILILSAVNPVTSPGDLVVQLTLRIPSGWSVASSEFGSAVGGLPTAVYQVRIGKVQQISVHLLANEPYQGEIMGYIDYYFDTGDQAKHHNQVNLPVTARQDVDKQDTTTNSSSRGITWVIVGIVLGVLSVAGFIVRRLIL